MRLSEIIALMGDCYRDMAAWELLVWAMEETEPENTLICRFLARKCVTLCEVLNENTGCSG